MPERPTAPNRTRHKALRILLYLTGREPVMRISTSLLALCCQLGLDASSETRIRARSWSNGSRSLRGWEYGSIRSN